MCNFRVWLVFILFLLATPVSAITIDTFKDDQSSFVNVINPDSELVDSTSEALGGTRSLNLHVSGGPLLSYISCVDVGCSEGLFSHNEGSNATGRSILSYDGDLVPGITNPVGLGGFDLTGDGASAFVIKILSFDLPTGNAPLPIKVRVYDANDNTGNKWSEASVSLSNIINSPGVDLLLPFANFSIDGPAGAVSFNNVGAIELTINGAAPSTFSDANDLEIGTFRTNGECNHIPQVGAVLVDDCGICGGDNSSCTDCQGLPNGEALPGTECDTGDVGVCKFGKYLQSCDCQQVVEPSEEICDGLDNDCDAEVDEIIDRCGVCGGDGMSCIVCESIEQTEELRKLDGGAKKLERAIKKIYRKLRVYLPRSEKKRIIQMFINPAHELQIRNWTLSWQLPAIANICEDSVFCVTTSNLSILDEYRSHNHELLVIFKRLFHSLRKLQGYLSYEDRATKRYARGIYRDNLNRTYTIPELDYSCE